MNRELFYVENSKIPVSSTERRPYSYGPLETFDVADDRVRVPRQGPPEPIQVEPSPPVCGTCGAPLVRDDRHGRQVVLVCPTNCKRVARTDAP